MNNIKTKLTNYAKRLNFTCEVLNQGEASQNARVQFIIRKDYYIDVIVEGELIKTTVDKVAAIAIARTSI